MHCDSLLNHAAVGTKRSEMFAFIGWPSSTPVRTCKSAGMQVYANACHSDNIIYACVLHRVRTWIVKVTFFSWSVAHTANF